MKWSIVESDITSGDSSGVEGFIARMESELRRDGQPLEGFKFLNSATEMLRFTREIENEVLTYPENANLYVGFQTGVKLDIEASRYRKLKHAGINAIGFGTGTPEANPAELLGRWQQLSYETKALENQWFLVSRYPTSVAFVGWEISEKMFGQNGLSTPGKEFKGFVSSDTRVVEAMIAYFEQLTWDGLGQRSSFEELEGEVVAPLRKVLTLTDGRNVSSHHDMREATADFALAKSAEVVLYDLSAASTLSLVSPYPEDKREEWLRILNKEDLNYLGRGFLSQQVSGLESKGIEVGAILPERPGFVHLAEWVAKEKIELIVIPEDMTRPGLIDRLRGFTLETLLERVEVPVIVYKKDGSIWIASNALAAAR